MLKFFLNNFSGSKKDNYKFIKRTGEETAYSNPDVREMNNSYNKYKSPKLVNFINNDNFEEVFISKSSDKLEKDSKIYKILQKLYSDDVKNLEKLLGYKTEWW